MKRFAFSLLYAFCSIFFTYCSSSDNSPTVKATLILNITNQDSLSDKAVTKTIIPDIDMTIATYTITPY